MHEPDLDSPPFVLDPTPNEYCVHASITDYFGAVTRQSCHFLSRDAHGSLYGKLAFRTTGADETANSFGISPVYCYFPERIGVSATFNPVLFCYAGAEPSGAVDFGGGYAQVGVGGRASRGNDAKYRGGTSEPLPDPSSFLVLGVHASWVWRCTRIAPGGFPASGCSSTRGRVVIRCMNDTAALTCTNSGGHGFSFVKTIDVSTLEQVIRVF